MGALALPKKYSIANGTVANAITKRIGIKFNGQVRPLDVVAYDVEKGFIKTNKGETLFGVVEPYWR